ncbi:hypothetical protein GCM10009547_00390 [Sporichthya brevicatena]|uniref:Type II secretion system protein GspF domain-containing protein n=1 Tax=Sporichthya brevicatena TaxID=171442 RepID=A0ABP3R4K6_9ACTN
MTRGGSRGARDLAEAAALADLLAACLAAGCSPDAAARAAARARPGPVAAALGEAADQIEAGADPARAWRGLGVRPELAGLGRALARTAESGTAAAAAVSAEAARHRVARRLAAEAALARVGVLAALPLGLCFLPAFLCLGVVPVVLDLGGGLLSN